MGSYESATFLETSHIFDQKEGCHELDGVCNSLTFRSFSRDLRNEIDQCTYSEISPGNAHSRDANLRGKASTGLSSHDQRT